MPVQPAFALVRSLLQVPRLRGTSLVKV
jgi:hypothetical protein